jgi:hypothetical protein
VRAFARTMIMHAFGMAAVVIVNDCYAVDVWAR